MRRADLNTHRASSKQIQNKNDNFNDFLSLSIKTSKANIKLKSKLRKINISVTCLY